MKNVLLVDHVAERPKTDFRLIRLCEWAGYRLSDFQRKTIDDRFQFTNPDNSVVVPMGPRAMLGCAINRSILEARGYVWSNHLGYVIPTVSPGYIQRGNAKWSAAFIADLQKAVHLGSSGLPVHYNHYVLDPSPLRALEWAKEYVRELDRNPSLYLAFDIETPGKGDDEEELDGEHDRTWIVERIGFSYQSHSALSIPWAPEYYAAIRLILSTMGPKVVWNAGFDVPRVRRAGVDINGTIHDGMVAWHILHSDLPKALRFVATFTCPWQPAWKHLSGAKPAFYNATDADVEYRSMVRIEEELRRTGMWEVYEKDVVELEPILVHMHRMGMPVDAEIRLDRAIKLDNELHKTRAEMEQCVPLEARKIAIVYKSEPKCTEGLLSRPGRRTVPVCSVCGTQRPTKPHFRRLKKKQNPCEAGFVNQHEVEVTEFFRLAEFTPSRDQLIRYHELLNRPCLRTYDKKERRYRISFAEKQIKELRLKYPDDKLYELVLTYRSLDKLAGTYIGRPINA
jgi:hypothetical protein